VSHDTLVLVAKTFGPIWMLGFLLIVAIRAFAPSRRAAHERAARSILPEEASE